MCSRNVFIVSHVFTLISCSCVELCYAMQIYVYHGFVILSLMLAMLLTWLLTSLPLDIIIFYKVKFAFLSGVHLLTNSNFLGKIDWMSC